MNDLKIVNNKDTAFSMIINKNYALLVSRFETMYTNHSDLIKCLDKTETFATFPIAFYVKKDFQMIKLFNKIIRYAFEAGLIDLWQKQFTIKTIKTSTFINFEPIHMYNLYAVIILIGLNQFYHGQFFYLK